MAGSAPSEVVVSAEEIKCFQKVVNAFGAYKAHSLNRIGRCTQYVRCMNGDYRRYLKKYSEHLENLKICVDVNNDFLEKMIKDTEIFENLSFSSSSDHDERESVPTSMDMDKVFSTLRQFAREWSADGENERRQCFLPLLVRAEKLFPRHRSEVKVLVPGAGLGRLAFEFASRGFYCEGNEFSFHMLSASFYILNKSRKANEFRIYPYLGHFSNNFRNEDQTRVVSIPDVLPGTHVTDRNFSMTAGDFIEVYGKQSDRWNIVCTCFFIDTAQNIVEYLDIIFRILRPGGYWLNLGPLLYHHADMPKVDSIEPSFEDVKNIAKAIGFAILEEETDLTTSYCSTPASMLEYVYKSVLLVCQKPATVSEPSGEACVSFA